MCVCVWVGVGVCESPPLENFATIGTSGICFVDILHFRYCPSTTSSKYRSSEGEFRADDGGHVHDEAKGDGFI